MEGIGLLLLWIVFAVVGWILASNKGRSAIGWAVLGFLFPPALLILLVLKPVPQSAER